MAEEQPLPPKPKSIVLEVQSVRHTLSGTILPPAPPKEMHDGEDRSE